MLIFALPESCWTSEAAIFSMSCWAVTFGRSGFPALAKAGTIAMVAAATPNTATGTAYRAALRVFVFVAIFSACLRRCVASTPGRHSHPIWWGCASI